MSGGRFRARQGSGRVRRAIPRWTMALVMGLTPLWARAEGLQVTPVLLEFNAEQKALAVWLSNTAEHSVRAQVRLRSWHQADGRDVLEPTNELVASPPLVEIPAGQTQLVRIVRMPGGQPADEAAYRLLVDELPPQDTQGAPARPRSGGIQFLFRYLIPVFVAAPQTDQASAPGAVPAGPAHALDAHLLLEGKEQAHLTVRNAGKRRVRLSDMTYVDAHGVRTVLGTGLFGYVLAGAQRQWSLQVPPSLEQVDGSLRAKVNEDNHETVLGPGSRGR